MESPCEEPIEVGYGPCGRETDEKVYPEYVADDFDFKVKLEYDLRRLPMGKNNLVSFSITGATQEGNITPLVPADEFGYNFQVCSYLDLYDKSRCFAIPEKDLFFYTDVGLSDFLLLVNLIVEGIVQPDANSVIQWLTDNTVTPALLNVKDLFSEGKARRMFVQIIDGDTIRLLPVFKKLQCIQNIDEIISFYDLAMTSNIINPSNLQDSLNDFAQNQVPNFELTVLLSSDLYEEVTDNSNAYGIVNDGQTMLDLGWPKKVFPNQTYFDDISTSSHTNRVFANFVKTWFQQNICNDC